MQNKLSKILELFGITQISLAEKAGLDAGAISRIVNGKRRPPLDIAVRLAGALRERLASLTVEDIWNCDTNASQAAQDAPGTTMSGQGDTDSLGQ